MGEKNVAAVELAKLSRKVPSAAQSEASRVNGRKGGRKKLVAINANFITNKAVDKPTRVG